MLCLKLEVIEWMNWNSYEEEIVYKQILLQNPAYKENRLVEVAFGCFFLNFPVIVNPGFNEHNLSVRSSLLKPSSVS
jgi:hypothetical protein